MGLAAAASQMIDKRGEAMTLKRSGETDLTVKGKRSPGSTADIGGSAAQQAFTIRLSTTQLQASTWEDKAPRRTDSIVIGGKTRAVLDARPVLDGEVVALHELDVAG